MNPAILSIFDETGDDLRYRKVDEENKELEQWQAPQVECLYQKRILIKGLCMGPRKYIPEKP